MEVLGPPRPPPPTALTALDSAPFSSESVTPHRAPITLERGSVTCTPARGSFRAPHPTGEGWALVPVAGAADRVRGLGRRAKAPCSHRRRPLGSSQLNRICHSLCRPPAGSLPGPPLVWGAPTGGPGCWAQAEALPLPLPLPRGSTTHSCARM